MSQSTKEQILEKVKINDYIGRFVKLQSTGNYLKGLCPFHNEKTPSFSVTPDKGIYHCFGCGNGGDLFTFVQEYEKVDFVGSLKILSEFAGIEYKPGSNGEKKSQDKKPLLKINKSVVKHYYNHLRSSDGAIYKSYCIDRGLNDKSLDTFIIGSAPNDWQYITDKLEESNKKQAESIGIIHHKNKRYYDFYRNRIIFPIRETSGYIIGMGGRSLDPEDKSKYINSPESDIFHKGSSLYGLYECKDSIKELDTANIVEGYLDVIGLYQSGITNNVAPLGTALTQDHIKLIKRYASNINLIMDGDKAGRESAIKSSKMILSLAGECKVVLLPDSIDGFDLSKLYGSDDIKEIIANGVSVHRFLLIEAIFQPKLLKAKEGDNVKQKIIDYHDRYRSDSLSEKLNTLDSKLKAITRLVELLKEIQIEYIVDLYIKEASQLIGIDIETIKKAYYGQPQKQQHKPQSKPQKQIDIINIERSIISEIIKHIKHIDKTIPKMQNFIFDDMSSETMWRYIEFHKSLDSISGKLSADTISVFSKSFTESSHMDKEDFLFMIDDFLLRHRRLQHKAKLKTAKQKMIDEPGNAQIMGEYSGLLKEKI